VKTHFGLAAIHQIEMTSHCNLRCRYCPSPHLARSKVHMTEEHWRKALSWAVRFNARSPQAELNLAGIGESTIHPEFVRFTHLAREALPNTQLTLATNGLTMTRELAQELGKARIATWVSLHRPEKAGPAVELLREVGVLCGVSADPSVAAMNWAGQVDWHNSAPSRECMWVKEGRAFVMADGRVSRCCLDATGEGVFATLDDDLARFATSPYSLCRTCDQDVGVPIPDSVPQRDNVVPLKFMQQRKAS
jgi:hypothetical protein